MPKKLKIFGITSAIIVLVVCLIIDCWYLYIKMYGPKKVVSTTIEVGLQKTVDGKSKYFMEVNSYDNCFEVKFNYMLDEDRTSFYSQGLQYYNDSENVQFREYTSIQARKRTENFWGWESTYYDYRDVLIANYSGTQRINYMSGDDYETTSISTNPISDNTYFKITLEEDGKDVVYLMKFKGDVLTSEKDIKQDKGWWYTEYATYYDVYDVDRLAGLVHSGLSSMAYGTECSVVFEFGDLFEYYEPVEGVENSYQLISHEKAELLVDDIKSYYSIKVTKHEGNIQKASESLFNCVNKNSGFNISNIESKDYFYGRTNISANNSAFNRVEIIDNYIALKLKDSFVNSFDDYGEQVQLQVLINLDELNKLGFEFVGFTADSGLKNFNILSCQTVETINGQLVYTEVAYA